MDSSIMNNFNEINPAYMRNSVIYDYEYVLKHNLFYFFKENNIHSYIYPNEYDKQLFKLIEPHIKNLFDELNKEDVHSGYSMGIAIRTLEQMIRLYH
jgi:hypothetical protein